jgi:hypothetical protein
MTERALCAHFGLSRDPIRPRLGVAHHYDLSGTLYDLFLDKDRQYSCAYFASDNDNLETARANKTLHLVAKLLLRPGQKVLDIGSGWGGLALYLAKLAGVDVTGVTLSTEPAAPSPCGRTRGSARRPQGGRGRAQRACPLSVNRLTLST